MEDVGGIVAAVVAAIAFIGALVARWNETSKDAKWYVRLARVFDLTQIVDPTRRLDD